MRLCHSYVNLVSNSIKSYRGTLFHLSAENQICQTIFDDLIERPFKRTCSVDWIKSCTRNVAFSTLGEGDSDVPLFNFCRDVSKEKINDTENLCFTQRIEDHYIIKTIQKLRFEMAFKFIEDHIFQPLITVMRHNFVTRDVGSQNDDCIGKV